MVNEKPTLNSFSPLAEIDIQTYERYLPTAFDESLTLLQKVNKVIEYMNATGKLVSDVVAKWNEIMEWIINNGLEDTINKRLDEWLADGTLEKIINENIFADLNKKIDDLILAFEDFKKEIDEKLNKVISNVGTPDEVTARLQKALDDTDGVEPVILSGIYNVNANLVGHNTTIEAHNAELRFSNAGDALTFRGIRKEVNLVAQAGYTKGRNYLMVFNTVGVEKGDLLRFISTTELYHPSRSYFYKGSSAIVTGVGLDRIFFAHGLPYDITSVNLIELYRPAKVTIEGKLRIENTGVLPNGQKGLYLQNCIDSNINNVVVDNFDTCISASRSVGIKYNQCESERAYYEGSGQSYGFINDSSNFVSYDSCRSKSGRHGFTSGGNEPLDFMYMKNCSFYNEPESGQRSFDIHNNAINVLIENCEMDAFQIAGNVHMRNITVQHLQYVHSTFTSSDDYKKANYMFENMKLPNGGQINLSGYAQSGGTVDTMTKIGSIQLVNVQTDDLDAVQFKLNARDYGGMPKNRIRSVKFQNTRNIRLLIGDDIDTLSHDGFIAELDNTFLFQLSADCLIRTATFKNSIYPARYVGITLVNVLRATFISCSDFNIGNSAPRANLSGPTTHVTFINCDFSNHTEGFDIAINTYTLIDSVVPFYGTPTGIAKVL